MIPWADRYVVKKRRFFNEKCLILIISLSYLEKEMRKLLLKKPYNWKIFSDQRYVRNTYFSRQKLITFNCGFQTMKKTYRIQHFEIENTDKFLILTCLQFKGYRCESFMPLFFLSECLIKSTYSYSFISLSVHSKVLNSKVITFQQRPVSKKKSKLSLTH